MYLNDLHRSFAPEIGSAVPRAPRRRPSSRWFLGDLIPDGETVDVDALRSEPLSTAGSYGEGSVQDALDRLNIAREAWAKKLITDGEFKSVLYPMTPRIIAEVERIARMGSNAASVVNTLWGEIQNQGYIGKDGNEWIHLFPPAWPPKPVQIVFPKPSRSGSNIFKKAAAVVGKAIAAPVTYTTSLAAKSVGIKDPKVDKVLGIGKKEAKAIQAAVPVAQVVGGTLVAVKAASAIKGALDAKAQAESAEKAAEVGYGAAADVAKAASAAKAAKAGFGAASTAAAAKRAGDVLSAVKTAVHTADGSTVKTVAEKTSKITDALSKLKEQLKTGSPAEKIQTITAAAKQAAEKVAEAKALVDSVRKPAAADQFTPFQTTEAQAPAPSFFDQKYAGVPVILLMGIGVLGVGYLLSRRAA